MRSIAKPLWAFGVIAIAKTPNSMKCIGYGVMQLVLIYLSRDQFTKWWQNVFAMQSNILGCVLHLKTIAASNGFFQDDRYYSHQA